MVKAVAAQLAASWEAAAMSAVAAVPTPDHVAYATLRARERSASGKSEKQQM